MNGLVYTRFELLRAFRNRRFFIFSLGFPLVLYFVIAGPQRNNHDFAGTGISAPLYYMAGLASFGTMMSMISTGARIAGTLINGLQFEDKTFGLETMCVGGGMGMAMILERLN